ncbi:integrase [Paraburkholderia bengalensis]|uniref:Integrase n=1 Tax=Paraburkholderia bengalensis TaxID=2747562 RepID=A0ABU8IW00_9BURK
MAWLERYDSKNTRVNYRKEAERLWLWATRQHGKAVSSLTHADILVYKQFLRNPQPADVWVLEGGSKLPRHHPEWRPFYRSQPKNAFDKSRTTIVGPILTDASVQLAISVLNAMFSWLVEVGYLDTNPVATRRRGTGHAQAYPQRYLPPHLWRAVLEYVEEMPKKTKAEKRRYQRARWIISLFYLSGMRVSEVAAQTMGCLTVRQSVDGSLQWWLTIEGRNQKSRCIPAISELIEELKAYRASIDLPALPSPQDKTPLVVRFCPQNPDAALTPMSRSALYVAVQRILEGAAMRLHDHGESEAASDLRKASASWLRNTAFFTMTDGNIADWVIRQHLGL